MELRTQDYIAGTLMITLGLIGFMANGLVLKVLRKSYRTNSFSAFSLLCCSRSLSNCGTLLCFIIYSGPVTLLGFPYGPEIVGRKFGHLTTLTYKSVVYVQLAIAFNRFVATFFSFKYPQICSRKGTFILLGCVWLMAVLHCIPEFLDGCGYTYFYESLAWDFIDTPCSKLLGGPILHYPSYTVFIGSIGLNVVIMSKLTYATLVHAKIMGGQAKERHRRNVRCFIQSYSYSPSFYSWAVQSQRSHDFQSKNDRSTYKISRIQWSLLCLAFEEKWLGPEYCASFLQELLYIFELFFLQQMDPTERFMQFVCYSLLWECTHVWDGLIVVLYRPDMRAYISCLSRRSNVQIHVIKLSGVHSGTRTEKLISRE